MASNMKGTEGVIYEDPKFRLIVRPDCVSNIDDPRRISKALHEEIELKYFYEGSATLLVGSKTIVVRAGDLVIMNPYEIHSTIRFGEDKGKYHLLMIDPDFFRDSGVSHPDLRRMLMSGDVCFSTLVRGNTQAAEIILRTVALQKMRPAYYQMSLRGLMLDLFALLLRDHSEQSGSSAVGNDEIRYFKTVEPAIQRMRDGYHEKLTVDELASLCRVSKCHFCRIFKKATGQTAMQYLTDYRLKIADVMLTDSSKSVAEITELCGFGDEGYFCRCYKKKFGSSPGRKRAGGM